VVTLNCFNYIALEDRVMANIQSDTEFRSNLSSLSLGKQRRLGKLFIDHVLELSDSAKVKKAVAIAGETEPSATDIAEGYKAASTAATESYTLCGREADWRRQASHFVAAAAAACLSPEGKEQQCEDVAWTTAMNARMARVCEKIAEGEGYDNSEIGVQYRILEEFLRTTS